MPEITWVSGVKAVRSGEVDLALVGGTEYLYDEYGTIFMGFDTVRALASGHDDPDKINPGICGCGNPDADKDGDKTPDCNDKCASDPGKTEPGTCGCGNSDADKDGDRTPDCIDKCPRDPAKIMIIFVLEKFP